MFFAIFLKYMSDDTNNVDLLGALLLKKVHAIQEVDTASVPRSVFKFTEEERARLDKLKELFPVSSRKGMVLFSLDFLEETFFDDEGDLLLGIGSDLTRISSSIESMDKSIAQDLELISKLERILLSGVRLSAVLGLGDSLQKVTP